jgi:hypothetical protein
MRTATTWFKKGNDKGHCTPGYDETIPLAKQRQVFNSVSLWPEGVLSMRYQADNSRAQIRSREKTENMVTRVEQAHKRADEKAALAKKIEADSHAAREKETAAKLKADTEAREKALKKPSK